MKKFFSQSGLSLIELIIAMTVINVGLFSVWTLFLSNFVSEREAQMKIVAVNLAREGIEAVKNERDSKWLKRDSGIANNDWSNLPVGNYIIGDLFNQAAGIENIDFIVCNSFNDNCSKVFYYGSSSMGFYFQQQTPPAFASSTPYKRIVSTAQIYCSKDPLAPKCNNKTFSTSVGQLAVGLQVKSEVRWQIEGKQRDVVIIDEIFDWR